MFSAKKRVTATLLIVGFLVTSCGTMLPSIANASSSCQDEWEDYLDAAAATFACSSSYVSCAAAVATGGWATPACLAAFAACQYLSMRSASKLADYWNCKNANQN